MDIINKSTSKINKNFGSSISDGNTFTSLLNWISANETFFIFMGFVLVIIAAVVILSLFRQASQLRDNVLFTNFNAIILAIGFMYLVYKFADKKIKILSITIDIGFILYITIGIFIVFILGD